MLYESSLKESHLLRLSEILALIKTDRRAYRRIKFRLEEKIRDYGLDSDLDQRALSRIFGGHILRRPELMAFIFDFVTIDASLILGEVKHEDETIPTILEQIGALSAEYGLQLETEQNPFFSMARDIDTRDLAVGVPAKFTGSFIGYRRGSRPNEIVRFYFRIFKPVNSDRPFVRYFNRYQRGYDSWNVTGGGVFTSDNILYMFGHARNRNNRSSLGYRMLALSNLGLSGILSGPLISMDQSGPIGARMVLIPIGNHVWTEYQKCLSQGQLIKQLINPELANDRQKFEDEIRYNLSNTFTEDGLIGISKLISNASSTVVTAAPDFDDELMQADIEKRFL